MRVLEFRGLGHSGLTCLHRGEKGGPALMEGVSSASEGRTSCNWGRRERKGQDRYYRGPDHSLLFLEHGSLDVLPRFFANVPAPCALLLTHDSLDLVPLSGTSTSFHPHSQALLRGSYVLNYGTSPGIPYPVARRPTEDLRPSSVSCDSFPLHDRDDILPPFSAIFRVSTRQHTCSGHSVLRVPFRAF